MFKVFMNYTGSWNPPWLQETIFLYYPSKVIESTEQIPLNDCLTWVGYNFIEERISLHLKFPEDGRESAHS